MEKLDNLFTDLFEVKDLTNNRLSRFASDHLACLNSNNPAGIFNAIIDSTQTALYNFRASQSKKLSSLGNRKAYTQTKRQARNAFTVFIRQQEGSVRGKFGKDSEAYIQFFPKGLTVYDRATNRGYDLLVKNIVARATQYQADLGVAFKDQAAALAGAYLTAEEEQLETKGQVSHTRSQVTQLRAALTQQLTFNALFIAANFLLQKNKARLYFNTSLLFAPHRKHIYKGKPAAGETLTVARLVYQAGKFMWMKNKGATTLTFQMYLQGQAVGNSFTLEPAQELHQSFASFFTNADELRVTNAGSSAGWYQVKEVA